jgi:hypothetical protein
VSAKRGDPVAPPPGKDEYQIRYDSRTAAEGWRELGSKAPGNTARAWQAMRTNPSPHPETERHHRLKGPLATVPYKGANLPQWQVEVTGAGRIWFLIDEPHKTVWLIKASVGHPKETE